MFMQQNMLFGISDHLYVIRALQVLERCASWFGSITLANKEAFGENVSAHLMDLVFRSETRKLSDMGTLSLLAI